MAACSATLVYAAYSDMRRLEVANSVSIVLALLFLPAALVFGLAMTDIGLHLAVGLVVLLAGFMLFSFGLTGGADAKLLAAAALWVGPGGLAHLLIFMALIGGALAVVILIVRAAAKSSAAARLPWLQEGRWRDAPIPFCVAISAAAILSLPSAGFWPTLLGERAAW